MGWLDSPNASDRGSACDLIGSSSLADPRRRCCCGIVLAAPALPATSVGGSTTAATSVAPAALEVGQFLSLIGETFTARILTGEYEDTRGTLRPQRCLCSGDDPWRAPSSGSAQPTFQPALHPGQPARVGKSGIVRFEHDAIGNVELFVHQVRQASSDAPVYEAVLNCRRIAA
ncbi:MAG: hypothetical protein R2849_07135 [Thermomicrobiales bacterium]